MSKQKKPEKNSPVKKVVEQAKKDREKVVREEKIVKKEDEPAQGDNAETTLKPDDEEQ